MLTRKDLTEAFIDFEERFDAKMEARFADFARMMKRSFDDVYNRLSGIDEKIVGIEIKVERIEKKVDDIETKVERIDKKVDDIENKIETIESYIARHDQKLESHDTMLLQNHEPRPHSLEEKINTQQA